MFSINGEHLWKKNNGKWELKKPIWKERITE